MSWTGRAALGAALVALAAPCALAQTDYRNLDDDRPTLTEDAYPMEAGAIELMFPWRVERARGGPTSAVLLPELMLGPAANTQVGVKVPVGWDGGTAGGRVGAGNPEVFGFYNVLNESAALPALTVRADVSVPVGNLGADTWLVTFKLMATRSWGLTRLHVNAAHGVGATVTAARLEPPRRWWVGAAVDRTLWRQSVLLLAETYLARPERGEPLELNAAAGLRAQLTPTLVLDAGAVRRLRATGPDLGLTASLNYTFGLNPVRVR